MRLEPLLHPDTVIVAAGAHTRDGVLGLIAGVASPRTPGISSKQLLDALIERESKYPTATPEAIAFPHALMPEITSPFIGAVLLREPVRWSEQDYAPQDLVFAIFGSSDTPWEHVRVLARLARIVRGAGALERLRSATDAAGLYQRLIEEDRAHG